MKKIIALLFAFIPFNVFALESMSVGVMSTDYNLSAPVGVLFDNTTVGQSFTIGLHTPIHWLTVDIGLHNNGDSSRSIGPFNFELESKSVVTLVKGEWPIATISGMALRGNVRAGLSITQFRAHETVSGLSNTSTDIGYAYGAGLSLDITPHWALELNALRKQHKANLIPLTESSAHMMQGQLQLRYTF